MNDKKLLEVGDFIYDWDRWRGMSRYSIERVTDKQAFYCNNSRRCKRELSTSGFNQDRICAAKIGEHGSIDLETPELKKRYQLQVLKSSVGNLIRKVERINIEGLGADKLLEISDLLNKVLSVQVSDTTGDQ